MRLSRMSASELRVAKELNDTAYTLLRDPGIHYFGIGDNVRFIAKLKEEGYFLSGL
jgi:hypothetical protein